MYGVWYFSDCMRGALSLGVIIMLWLHGRGDFRGILKTDHLWAIGLQGDPEDRPPLGDRPADADLHRVLGVHLVRPVLPHLERERPRGDVLVQHPGVRRLVVREPVPRLRELPPPVPPPPFLPIQGHARDDPPDRL